MITGNEILLSKSYEEVFLTNLGGTPSFSKEVA